MEPLIYCDTRQQAGKHENIDRWFAAHGVPYEYRALRTGDYVRADGTSNIIIDTKRGLDEVAGNCGRQHNRFVRELDRARDAGCRLVILVEAYPPYMSMNAVVGWRPQPCRRCRWRGNACDPLASGGCRRFKRKPMQGPTLLRTMRSLERKHGCRFELCHPARSAARICELLGVEVKSIGEIQRIHQL